MPRKTSPTPPPDQHIVLTGPMGAGKTRAGQAIADALARPFHDVDAEIVAEFGAIGDLFEREGEEGFRAIEARVALRLLTDAPGVIALGGGTVLDPGVRAALEPAFVVYLDVSADAVSRRLTGEDRPLLRDGFEAWDALYGARRHLYDAVSDIRIDTSRRSVDEVARAVVDELPSRLVAITTTDLPARAVSEPSSPVPLTIHELADEWALRNRDARQVELIGLLRRAAEETSVTSDALLAEHGLGRGQFDVLAALYRRADEQPITQAQLATRMLVSPAGIQKRLAGLVSAGYVDRVTDADDHRRLLLALTPAGRERLESLLDDFFAAEGASLTRLDSLEQRQLTTLLRAMLGLDAD